MACRRQQSLSGPASGKLPERMTEQADRKVFFEAMGYDRHPDETLDTSVLN
ncbi:MAG: hypothetical protein IKI58_01985 [Oscillospiraceae bacterium]|nr:hypothetical protein [Oscillospiraceae bacterium]